MPSALGYAGIVAVHTIDALAGLREHQLVDTIFADLALEAVRVIGIVASHNGFIEDGEATNVAAI
jgi:hypothetical protein